MEGLYSIQHELGPDSTVLVTGGTGFVGSLVAEAILRTTHARVLVLARGKAGQAPSDRLAKLLDGPIFRMLKEQQPHKLARIEVIQVGWPRSCRNRHPQRQTGSRRRGPAAPGPAAGPAMACGAEHVPAGPGSGRLARACGRAAAAAAAPGADSPPLPSPAHRRATCCRRAWACPRTTTPAWRAS